MQYSDIEKDLLKDEKAVFCGIDEAGRGCLAGAVFAAAVVLPREIAIPGLDDSKKLSPKKRDELFDVITASAVAWCVASADETEIDKINILQATFLAMKRALAGLPSQPNIALIDGNRVPPGLDCKAIPVIGGDGVCQSIAAASILAKVSRDRYMDGMAKLYPAYQFGKHKGYGTKLHYEMIRQYGVSEIHRLTFLKELH